MALSGLGIVLGLLALAIVVAMVLRVRRRRRASPESDLEEGKMFNNPIYKRPADALPLGGSQSSDPFRDDDDLEMAVSNGTGSGVALALNPEYMASDDVPLQQEYTAVAPLPPSALRRAPNPDFEESDAFDDVFSTIAACAAEATAGDVLPPPSKPPRSVSRRISRRISRRASRDYGVTGKKGDLGELMEPLAAEDEDEEFQA